MFTSYCTKCFINLIESKNIGFKDDNQLLCKRCYNKQKYNNEVNFIKSNISQCKDLLKDTIEIDNPVGKLQFSNRIEILEKELKELEKKDFNI